MDQAFAHNDESQRNEADLSKSGQEVDIQHDGRDWKATWIAPAGRVEGAKL